MYGIYVVRRYIPLVLFVTCRPSTFAQAAKLRRMAATKEKELSKSMLFGTFFLSFFFFKNGLTWSFDEGKGIVGRMQSHNQLII